MHVLFSQNTNSTRKGCICDMTTQMPSFKLTRVQMGIIRKLSLSLLVDYYLVTHSGLLIFSFTYQSPWSQCSIHWLNWSHSPFTSNHCYQVSQVPSYQCESVGPPYLVVCGPTISKSKCICKHPLILCCRFITYERIRDAINNTYQSIAEWIASLGGWQAAVDRATNLGTQLREAAPTIAGFAAATGALAALAWWLSKRWWQSSRVLVMS